MLICQASKAFARHLYTCTPWAFPLHGAVKDAMFHIQRALVVQDFALIQAKALAVHKQFNRHPIRRVSQLLFADIDTIEDTKQQGGGICAWIGFFEGAPCAEIAVADSIDRFMAVQLLRVKPAFTSMPEIHNLSFLPA